MNVQTYQVTDGPLEAQGRRVRITLDNGEVLIAKLDDGETAITGLRNEAVHRQTCALEAMKEVNILWEAAAWLEEQRKAQKEAIDYVAKLNGK